MRESRTFKFDAVASLPECEGCGQADAAAGDEDAANRRVSMRAKRALRDLARMPTAGKGGGYVRR
ncbi:hypothetical protein GCM10010169_22310 [Micromonospora fulviviridis]|nr:hypothetical protein GCM10010169_22310 [Micromonospora fulviviridis]